MVSPKKSTQPAASSPVLVFVDVDNTLVKGASIFMFAIEAWKSGFIKWHHVIPALFQQRYFIKKGETSKRLNSTRERAQALVAGHSVAAFEQVAEIAWRRSIAPKVFPEILQELQDHLGKGRQVWLLTASPQGLASVMARDLRLTGAIGTSLEMQDGNFTGNIDGELLHGPNKAAAAAELAQRLDANLRDCFAYSDSAADIPLLESVGNPRAVNPDSALLAHAQNRGWLQLWPGETEKHKRRRS